MKRWFLVGALLVGSAQVSAQECLYKAPVRADLPYHEGAYLPVYFSKYQFNLPSKPSVLLSGDGFIASYPERDYIGQQHANAYGGGDSSVDVETSPPSIADSYRQTYGLVATETLSAAQTKEVMRQRALLRLDCNARVHFYRIGDAVDVVWHEPHEKDDAHIIWVLGEGDVELITARRPVVEVKEMISSIKKRT